MQRKFVAKKAEDLDLIAASLIDTHADDKIFVFYGDLGAGKTTFIKRFCKILEVKDMVQSPSFSIINEYKTKENMSVYHMDFYRIDKLEEVFDIGFEEYLYSGSYCFIEWPEKIEQILPQEMVRIYLKVEPDESRTIRVR